MKIRLILRYQHITRQIIKQYLTHKHDILQTCNCKGSHVKMTTLSNINQHNQYKPVLTNILYSLNIYWLILVNIS